MNTKQLMKRLAAYHFESQGGPLENCVDYQKFCVRAVYLESLLEEAAPLLRLEFNENGPQRLLAKRIASAMKDSSEEPTRCIDCGVSLVPEARHFSGCKSHPGERAVKARAPLRDSDAAFNLGVLPTEQPEKSDETK